MDTLSVGKPVEVRAYAERIECWQGGKIVGQHQRVFGRDNTIYDPLHYIPLLAPKPAASHPSRPIAAQSPAGQWMVDFLGMILTDGLDAVETACAEALSHNVHSAGVVLNILARHREPEPALTITKPVTKAGASRTALKAKAEETTITRTCYSLHAPNQFRACQVLTTRTNKGGNIECRLATFAISQQQGTGLALLKLGEGFTLCWSF